MPVMSVAPKAMGFWRVWSVVVGITIGSGIFMLPALLAPYGLIGLLGWVVTGAGTILLAMMLARLSARLPVVGGPYAYTRAGLGEFAGFLIGWGYWISIWSGIGAIAVAFVGYMGFLFPFIIESSLAAMVTGALGIWVLAGINMRSISGAAGLQLVTTMLKILPLLLIIVLGFANFSVDAIPERNPSGEGALGALAAASMLIMWAFVGFEGGTVPAADIENPEKTIPRALIWGSVSVTIIYLLSSAAVMITVPADELGISTAPFADAAVVLIGAGGATLVALGAIISTLGSLNGNILLSGQMLRAAGEDGLCPPFAARLTRHQVPANGIAISCVIATALLISNYTKGLIAAFEFMLLLSTLTTLVPLAFSAVAELRFLKGDQISPGRTRALILNLIAFTYVIFLILGSGTETVFWGFILLLLGMPIYAWLAKSKKLPIAEEYNESL